MKFTIKQIATLLGAETEGDENLEISDLAKIEEGKPGTITFLANPKYEPYIYSTNASAVIVARSFKPAQAVPATLLKVEDPYSAFTSLLEMASSMIRDKKGIEKPNFIADSAEIGEDVYIGAFAYIGNNSRIGKGAKIYPNAYIGDNTVVGDHSIVYPQATVYFGCRVGAHCILHSGAVIGSDGFGFAPQENGEMKKIPQTGIVVLEDYVEVGANASIDRATLGETRIRRGVKLDNLVQIAHNADIGENTVIASQSGVSGSTKLGKNIMLGGQVGVVGHINLADGTKVGAQSGVSKNVPKPNTVLRGSPAQDMRRQLRSEALFRNLESMAKRIAELEQKIAGTDE